MRKATMIKKGKKTISPSRKREVISNRLRRGDLGVIATLAGYERSHVSRVLRGIRSNPAIVDAAYSYVSKRKAKA